MKFLKSKIEAKFGVNEFNQIFNYIDNYINNWYSDENELMSFIREKVNISIISANQLQIPIWNNQYRTSLH